MTKIAFVSLAVALSVVAVVRADDPSQQQVIDKFLAIANGKLDVIKQQLAEDLKAQKQAAKQKDSARAKQLSLKIKAEQKQIDSAPKIKDLPIPQLKALEVGSIGKLTPRFKVLQVIDANHMLVEWGDRPVPHRIDSGEAVLAGSPEALAHMEEFRRQGNAVPFITLMLEVSTENVTDNTLVNLEKVADCWRVYKKATYQTAAGTSKTVLVARPYDLAEVRKVWNRGPQVNPAGKPANNPKPADVAANPSNNAEADPRMEWLNESYHVTLRHLQGKDWAEFNNDTGKLWLKYEETGRADDFISLDCPERNQKLRVRSDKIELFKNDNWEWVATGKWISPPAK